MNAPKSLSVLFAIAPEATSGVLVGCHEEAVRAALGYLEDTAVMVRRGHGGERVEPGEGLIAAAYRHRMSRSLDPQLHTHVVAGEPRAWPGRPLHRAAQHAALSRPRRQPGTSTRRTCGHSSASGSVSSGARSTTAPPSSPTCSAAVVEDFSKRRHEMQRAAEAGGIRLGTKASAERAALATRERKQYGIDTHTWREEVRARAAELGFGAREVAELLEASSERAADGLAVRVVWTSARSAICWLAPQGLTERANTFDERAVLQEFASAAARARSCAEVRAQAERFAARADVLATARGEITTVELVELRAAADRIRDRPRRRGDAASWTPRSSTARSPPPTGR